MRLKEGVTVVGMRRQVLAAMVEVVNPIYNQFLTELVITNGFSKDHGHSRGDAFDTRLPKAHKKELRDRLQESLPGYKVTLEPDHYHIERMIVENHNSY